MTSRPTDFSMRGAVPLDRLSTSSSAPTATAGSGNGAVTDITEATFERDVLQRSSQVPVVIDFWADWCGPCKQLSPVLEKLATEANGAWVLAKIDIDANPRLAQAFGVQSIPMVLAVVGGRPVELFAGAMGESQVRQVMDQVVALAEQMGIRGMPLDDTAPADSVDDAPPLPAYEIAAQQALDRGDLRGAAAAYEEKLRNTPGNEDARAGLARVQFVERVQGLADDATVRRAAADRPDDIDVQLAVADLDVNGGHIEDAFHRLVQLVMRTAGDDRDRVRQRLLSLFDVVGPDDPRVPAARRALTNALF